MTNQQKADAYRNAIEGLAQQRFAKETEIALIDAQVERLEADLAGVTDDANATAGASFTVYGG
jgi:predicted  nucleic acid-binding Zn-ribbon protein